MISRENYEIVFIDYLDGRLTQQEEAELQRFLQNNPDLKEELDAVGGIKLVADTVSYDQKSQLKHTFLEDEQLFNNACIASLEKDLNEKDAHELQNFIAVNPDRKKTWLLFKSTKLNPDPSIVFKDKKFLYKKAIVWLYLPQVATIAAAILLGLLVVGTIEHQTNLNTRYTARNLSYHITAPEAQISSDQATIEMPVTSVRDINTKDQAVSHPHETILAETPGIENSKAQVASFEPVLAKLSGKKRSLPTHIYIYKPQLALSNIPSKPDESRRPIQKINQIGRDLLTDNTGKLKNIPKQDIQTGLLGAVQRITNDIINFETDETGKLKTLNLNGELLAFSIPLSNN